MSSHECLVSVLSLSGVGIPFETHSVPRVWLLLSPPLKFPGPWYPSGTLKTSGVCETPKRIGTWASILSPQTAFTWDKGEKIHLQKGGHTPSYLQNEILMWSKYTLPKHWTEGFWGLLRLASCQSEEKVLMLTILVLLFTSWVTRKLTFLRESFSFPTLKTWLILHHGGRGLQDIGEAWHREI